MSVTAVSLYCSNCRFKKVYSPEEKVPGTCPNCKAESKPRYEWLRNNVRYLPTLVWLLLMAVSGYYVFVARANELPWFPLVMALAVFALVWMLGTLFRPWPRSHKGPWVVRQLRWASEGVPPETIIGRGVMLKLEESLHRRRASATIQSCIARYPAEPDDEYDEEETEETQYRLYILMLKEKLGDIAREGGHVLFKPEWVEFKRGATRRLRKQHGNFSYTPSMEDLLLNPRCQFKAIEGRVYNIQNPEIITKQEFQWSATSPIALGKIYPQ